MAKALTNPKPSIVSLSRALNFNEYPVNLSRELVMSRGKKMLVVGVFVDGASRTTVARVDVSS